VNKVCYQFPVHALGSSELKNAGLLLRLMEIGGSLGSTEHVLIICFLSQKADHVIKAVLSLVRSEQGRPSFIFVRMEVGAENKFWSCDSVLLHKTGHEANELWSGSDNVTLAQEILSFLKMNCG
jgi:hypothetical protein